MVNDSERPRTHESYEKLIFILCNDKQMSLLLKTIIRAAWILVCLFKFVTKCLFGELCSGEPCPHQQRRDGTGPCEINYLYSYHLHHQCQQQDFNQHSTQQVQLQARNIFKILKKTLHIFHNLDK